MANEEQLGILKGGVENWNKWRAENRSAKINLKGADLRDQDFTGINLKGAALYSVRMTDSVFARADLSDTKFSRARARRVDFSSALMSGAVASNVDFSGAKFIGASLDHADFAFSSFREANLLSTDVRHTNLSFVNFDRACLAQVDMSEARLFQTLFVSTDLSNVLGLDRCVHEGPSSIDFETLRQSTDLPANFLQGCGLPDDYITYIRSLTSNPFDFYSCFISYSHADKSFAQRLHDQLQSRGIRCWLDEHQLLPGDDVHDQIDRGIKHWDKTLLCCSEASLKKSWWVDREINSAFTKEVKLMKERGIKTLALIPLNLDGYFLSEDWKNGKKDELQARLAADFKGWETDNSKFEEQFEKVEKALKTKDGGREVPPDQKL